MALNAVIAETFKKTVAIDPRLAVLLPGDLHYGRADTSAVRPFGSFTVKEREREYDSGYSALVTYELTLTVYGKQRGSEVGEILQAFAAVVNRGGNGRPLYGSQDATMLCVMHLGSTLAKDETEEFGKDVMVGQSTWLFYVNEYEKTLV